MPPQTDAAIDLVGLRKVFPAPRSSRRRGSSPRAAVDGISLQAHRGRVTALLGPNGAGKTTTLECAQGLQKPTAGTVRLLGEDPWQASPELRARVGVMLQDGGLPQSVRPVPLLRHVSGFYRDPADMDELIGLLGIDSFAGTSVRRLSGGQRQRVALAAALAGRPEVLFLDEPSAGLDPQSRQVVFDLVARLRDQGVCIVLTTHLLDDAQRLADHVYILDHGTVKAQGTVTELIQHSADGAATLEFAFSPQQRRQLEVATFLPWLSPLFETVEVEDRGTSVVCTGDLGPEHLRAVGDAFAAVGSLPLSLHLQPKTLEDVYLDVAGREIR